MRGVAKNGASGRPRLPNPTYRAVHKRMGRAADHDCALCGGAAREWAYQGGCPNERSDERGRPYSEDPTRYLPLCVRCHAQQDGRRGRPKFAECKGRHIQEAWAA